MDNLQTLQTLLQLGWPAIVLIECVILWRDNVALRTRLIDHLEKDKERPNLPELPRLSEAGQD